MRRYPELNALTSDQLVGFIEGKLVEHGIRKVIPQDDLLGYAYRLFVRSARLKKIVEKAIEDIQDQDDLVAPVDLRESVAEYLLQHPELSWDAAVAAIADEVDLDEGVGD